MLCRATVNQLSHHGQGKVSSIETQMPLVAADDSGHKLQISHNPLNRPAVTLSYVVSWGRSTPAPGIAQLRGLLPAAGSSGLSLGPRPRPRAPLREAVPRGRRAASHPPGPSGQGLQVGPGVRCRAWGCGPREAATRAPFQAPGIQWLPPPANHPSRDGKARLPTLKPTVQRRPRGGGLG